MTTGRVNPREAAEKARRVFGIPADEPVSDSAWDRLLFAFLATATAALAVLVALGVVVLVVAVRHLH